MSKEIKIGLLAIAAVALSYWGYKFIIGKNLLVRSNTYQVLYDEVQGLQIGTETTIKGVRVGAVSGIDLLFEEKQKVLVTLQLDKGVMIPKDTRAIFASTGFMGGKAIILEFDQPCSGPDCAEPGSFLRPGTRSILAYMTGADDLSRYIEQMKEALQSVLDSLNYQIQGENSQSPIAKTMRNLESTTASLKSATAQVDGLLRRSSNDINSAIADLSALTGTLEARKDQIGNIIANADTLSAQLAAAQLDQTVLEAQKTIRQLKVTLESAEQTLSGVTDAVGKIKSGEGTLGKLLQDEGLYNDLQELSTRADSLINDFQDRPYRYMPLKSRRKVRKYDRQDATRGNE